MAAATSKAEATQAAKTAVTESISAHKACKEGLASSEAEQKAGDADFEAAAEKKAQLESAVAGIYTPLKEGTIEAGQVSKKAGMFVSLGKKLGLDASLLTSLPNVLTKSPGDRGGFDTVVLEQAEAEISKCRDALVNTLDNGEPAKKERAAKVEVAVAKLAEAAEAERTCKASLEAAKVDQKESEAAQKAATKAVQMFGPEMKKVAASFETAKASLETLKAGPLKAFEDLLVYTAIAPPVEEKAETEAAVAEDAAPAEGTAAEAEPEAAAAQE